MSKLRIGYACLGRFSFDIDYARQIHGQCTSLFAELSYVCVVFDEVVETEEQARLACDLFYGERVDVIVLMYGTFALGTLAPIFAQGLQKPIVLWGLPEPSLDKNEFRINSFCGINLNAHTLKRLGHPCTYIFSDLHDGMNTLQDRCRIFSCLKTLKDTRLALVGARAPGFTPCIFDEVALRKLQGVEIHHISLLELDSGKQGVDVQQRKDVAADIRGYAHDCVVNQEELEEAAAYYIAFKTLLKTYGIDALAVKNWPELPVISGVMLGAVYSKLTSEGTMCSVEGDVYGAVSMLIANALTSAPPFFADLVAFDEIKNSTLFWHGGSAPRQWATNKEDIRLCRHFGAGGGDRIGTTQEFPIRGQGPVTIMRLGEGSDGFRMLAISGEMQDECPEIRGTPMNIKLTKPVQSFIDLIFDEGLEHHYIIVASDIVDDLQFLAKQINIPFMTL